MSYLLYCVFRSGPPPEPELPPGIHRNPVSVMDHGGLSAAVAETGHSDPTPDIAAVLAYESVVEFFFRRQTIIPMRYGCKVPDRSGLDAWLGIRHKEHDALLSRLNGLAEMGIQIPVKASDADCSIDSTAVQSAPSHKPMGSGVSYLLAKKQYYGSADRTAEVRNGLVNTLCQTLSGLFVRHKVEVSCGTAAIVSVYFLLPRTSVDLFRETALQHIPKELPKLTVSGPWPPYNFVESSNISGN
jgi:hypothetical protein